ncbi:MULTISPECIES: hypothetical protein [unclassified Kitasatospora]|uniref:hypothetical protein n=1 Tax=unclassified Kitasatospora TaxID=2633591 RepID=UPI0024771DCB|nr:hypothetical protein [Kitasatospora sp. GAS204B]
MDPGNQLLAGGPAQLSMSEAMTAGGKLATLTVRTASTTLTVFLERDDLQTWANTLQAAADRMSGLTVIRATGVPELAGVPS